MTNALFGVAVLSALAVSLSLVMPVVTELPWGMETPLIIFMENLNTALNVFPPLQVIWQVILIGFLIKISLIGFDIFYKIVKLLRGGG